jgi:DNA-3-methyladenine glycosylase II
MFIYGERETDYLSHRDKRLAQAIETIGPIEREVNPDLFAALIHSIVGQQISTKAHITIWNRILTEYGEISPATLADGADERLQVCGITFKKAGYIKNIARCVLDGSLDIATLALLPDDEVCKTLTALPGVGVWTAEMLMLFSMQRSNVFSFGDLAILRGLRMLHHHREITKPLFEKYRKRYSPYCSVASLYLWAIAGGVIPNMKDYARKAAK